MIGVTLELFGSMGVLIPLTIAVFLSIVRTIHNYFHYQANVCNSPSLLTNLRIVLIYYYNDEILYQPV